MEQVIGYKCGIKAVAIVCSVLVILLIVYSNTQDSISSAVYIVSAVGITISFYSIADVFLTKIILTETSITIKGPLKSKNLNIAVIDGYKTYSDGMTLIKPALRTMPVLTIYSRWCYQDYNVLNNWIARHLKKLNEDIDTFSEKNHNYV